MIGLVVTIALYIVAIAPGFFAVNDPNQQNGRAPTIRRRRCTSSTPIPTASWSFGLYFRPTSSARPADAGRDLHRGPDPQDRHSPLGEGYQYNFLGLFPTRIHLLASAEPRQPLFLFGRTGSAAASSAASCRERRSRSRSARRRLPLADAGRADRRRVGLFRRSHRLWPRERSSSCWRCPRSDMARAVPPPAQDWPAVLNYFMITIILSLTGWEIGPVVRGRFLSLRTEEFVTAARLDGASRGV